MVKVVFVCLGNICRSPMAEGVFANMVKRAGLDKSVSVDSCGTAEWYVGDPPHPGTLRVLAEHDIPFEHRGRQLNVSDLNADYLIPMDSDNLSGIQVLGQAKGELKLLLDYAPEVGLRDMPDPWYTGRFDETYGLVERGCVKLLEHIRQAEGFA
jgi:low molecular weight protein-tyrosine phosphatase